MKTSLSTAFRGRDSGRAGVVTENKKRESEKDCLLGVYRDRVEGSKIITVIEDYV